MTETRRQALKLLGTIGATCAFPFAGDELYGQHVHPLLLQAPAQGPYKPTFFTPDEYAALARLTDAIIPPSDTPGAAAAGVPEYIDRVVTLNASHQSLVRVGMAWLDREATRRFAKPFVSLDEKAASALLQPFSDELDRRQREAQRARFRTEAGRGTVYFVAVTDRDVAASPAAPAAKRDADNQAELPLQFFRLIKNLTADGYYTSRVGLLEELRYTGNSALATFPGCTVPEH